MAIATGRASASTRSACRCVRSLTVWMRAVWFRSVQIVIEFASGLVIEYYIGPTGSMHDSAAFARMDIAKCPELYHTSEEFGLADSAYPNTRRLSTVVTEPLLSTHCKYRVYNYLHAQMRVMVENVIARLKGASAALGNVHALQLSSAPRPLPVH
jgi:hypothetical protein